MAYRSTPSTVTGKTPSEMFIGRTLMKRIDVINKNRQAPVRKLSIVDKVQVRNYRGKQKWIIGIIIKIGSRKLSKVQIEDKIFIRHIDQLMLISPDVNQNGYSVPSNGDNWYYTVNIDQPSDTLSVKT